MSDPAIVATDTSYPRERLVPLILAALAAMAVVVSIEPFPVGVFQDDAIYTVLAKSLATGQGFRYLHLPDAPNATHYPPLYPLFLAGLWKLSPSFPGNVTLFKFANALFIGLTAVLAYRFARRSAGMGQWTAAFSVAAFTACAPVMYLSVMVLSEPLFLAALFPVLMASERAAKTGDLRQALLAGTAGGALALIRTLGIVVIPATALVLVWRRRWLAALLVCVAGVVVMLPWQLWVAAHDADVPTVLLGKYGSYTGWLMNGVRDGGLPWVVQLGLFNLRMFVGGGWELLSVDTLPPAARWAATFVVTAFFAGGMWLMLRKAPVAALMIAGYLFLVLLWPFPPQRFTFGIWPLLGLAFGLAVERILAWRPQTRAYVATRWVGAVLSAGLIAGYARSNYNSVDRGWWTRMQAYIADRAKPAAEWVSANTPEDAVIASEDEVLIHLYTGRRAIPLGTFTPQDHMRAQTADFATEALRTILRTYHVTYVLATTPFGARTANSLVRRESPELQFTGALELGAIYQPVNRTGAGSPSGRP